MKGVWGKILRVDLAQGVCRFEKIGDRVYEDFMGGAGMVAYTLWRECPQGTTAFDPANRLVFAAGPLQGIRQTGASKWTAGAISPAINMNADSAATASFGIELKKAGIDAVVVHGRAPEPCYVAVDDDKAEIKKCAALWSLNAYETEDGIKEREGGRFECATIGQAGEKRLRYANIQTRKKSSLGRCGLGAVMGSKLLKGVAISGSQSVPYHDPDGLKRLNNEVNRRLAKSDRALPFLQRCATAGTARATTRFAPQGNLPIKNYQLAEFPAGVEAFKTASYVERLNAGPWPCKYCVIQCHNKCEIKDGPYAYKGKGPEYESFAMMGLNTMIDDVEAVAYAGELANMYGMDTISLGSVLAWAMECYEKGVITRADAYGLELKWGNAPAMVEMVRKIGEREEGLAWLLGEGTRIAAQKIGRGSEQWAVQMKGQEIAAHNFRAQYISALNYCTGVAAGPNHERANSQHLWVRKFRLPEWGIDEVPNEERWSWEKAAERQAILHDYNNVVNSACHCKFMDYSGYTLTDLLATLNACTGLDWTHEKLRLCGERITNLQKLLNIRYGWQKADDFNYPKRFMESVDKGPAAGKIPVGLEDAIFDYYKERGWDEYGKPRPDTLKRLGLADI